MLGLSAGIAAVLLHRARLASVDHDVGFGLNEGPRRSGSVAQLENGEGAAFDAAAQDEQPCELASAERERRRTRRAAAKTIREITVGRAVAVERAQLGRRIVWGIDRCHRGCLAVLILLRE